MERVIPRILAQRNENAYACCGADYAGVPRSTDRPECRVHDHHGVYLSVDQALTADVLPDSHRYGRDAGIMNAAVSAPQVAAPVLAALLLGVSATYSAIFSVGALITLSGTALVLPIRRVRRTVSAGVSVRSAACSARLVRRTRTRRRA
jgi:hypothetical protein